MAIFSEVQILSFQEFRKRNTRNKYGFTFKIEMTFSNQRDFSERMGSSMPRHNEKICPSSFISLPRTSVKSNLSSPPLAQTLKSEIALKNEETLKLRRESLIKWYESQYQHPVTQDSFIKSVDRSPDTKTKRRQARRYSSCLKQKMSSLLGNI